MSQQERTSRTERRRATVLFADLTGFTALNERLDPEDAYGVVTGCLKRLDAVARRHGGSVEKYLGDAIMVVYGIPEALEGAAEAAINSAIEMIDEVDAYNRENGFDPPLGIHSGINSGLLISGDVSGPLIREFAVMGDTVNVASRLKDLAPSGEIWVGPETWRQARHAFEFRELEPMTLKGKRETLDVYAVESRETSSYRRDFSRGEETPAGLVGRDDALGRLEGALEGLAEGRGGIVCLIGEAGVGKSRLIDETGERARRRGLGWLEGRCLPVGAGLTYHLFRDLLRDAAGVTSGGPGAADRMRDFCHDLLGARAGEETWPLVAGVAGLEVPGEIAEMLETVPADALERLQVGAVGRLLEALARQRPVAIVFDDLHWSDRSSIDLLEGLLPLTRRLPVLMLVAFRPDYLDTSDAFLEGLREAEIEHDEIGLDPLDADAAGALLGALLEGLDVPLRLRERIREKTGGNPFFMEELVRALREGGDFGEDIEIPDTVQQVIMGRIDRLDPAPREVLEVAAVLGRRSEASILLAACERPDAESQLARLVELGFLTWSRTAGSVAFRHPLIASVAYDALLRERRQQLHRRAAETIGAAVAEGTPGRHGTLAFHFGKAGDVERAEPHLIEAGEEAARLAASSDALALFKEAFAIYESAPERISPETRALLQRNIAIAHFHRGHMVEAAEHLDRALEQRGLPTPSGGLRMIARMAWTLLRTLPALYVPALRRARPAATPLQRELVELMFKRSQAQTTTEPVRFLAQGVEVIGLLHDVDAQTVPGSGGLYAGLSGLFAYAGRFGLSERFLRRGHELVREDDPVDRVIVGLFDFVHHMLRGDWQALREIDAELLEEGLRRGGLWHVVTYLGMLGKLRIYRGEFDDAASLIEELGKIEERYAYGLARENRQGCAAFLALERGRLDEAIDACDAYFEATDEALPRVLALATRARALVRAGRLDEAAVQLDRAHQDMDALGVVPPFHASSVLRSDLMLAVARLEASDSRRGAFRARRTARHARRVAAAVAWRRPSVIGFSARLERTLGRTRRAIRRYEQALAEGERLSLRPEIARLHLEIGRHAFARAVAGHEAADHLARGHALARELGLAEGEDPHG
jgi:class 3 adenylate cyclase/tetratricopeptide (TPR) repeat protein